MGGILRVGLFYGMGAALEMGGTISVHTPYSGRVLYLYLIQRAAPGYHFNVSLIITGDRFFLFFVKTLFKYIY